MRGGNKNFITGDLSYEEKINIVNTLGVKQLCSSDKYLGLPILLGKSKTTSFNFIQDSFDNMIQR